MWHDFRAFFELFCEIFPAQLLIMKFHLSNIHSNKINKINFLGTNHLIFSVCVGGWVSVVVAGGGGRGAGAGYLVFVLGPSFFTFCQQKARLFFFFTV